MLGRSTCIANYTLKIQCNTRQNNMQGHHTRSSSRLEPDRRQWHIARIVASPKEHAGLTADAFIHLPELRSRVRHPEKSRLRLTPEMFAMWEQRVRAAGWPAGWRLSDEVIESSRLAVLGDHKAGDDLWLYSYGPLMWDPGFHFAEVRLADVEGYQRRFTLKINLGPGSHDYPALMLSLEPQEGCCRGMAFRIAADFLREVTPIR